MLTSAKGPGRGPSFLVLCVKACPLDQGTERIALITPKKKTNQAIHYALERRAIDDRNRHSTKSSATENRNHPARANGGVSQIDTSAT